MDEDSANRDEFEPFWCAVASVKRENTFGEDRVKRPGTKHFRGGAKVYIADAYWGTCDSVTVVGHHRGGGRYIKIDVHVKRLENFRLELVYSPKVAALIQSDLRHKNHVGRSYYTKEYAEKLVATLPLWIENYHTREE